MPHSSVSLLLGWLSAMLSVSLVSRVNLLLEVCTIICLGVNRHLASGHEISRSTFDCGSLHSLPFCNLYINDIAQPSGGRGIRYYASLGDRL